MESKPLLGLTVLLGGLCLELACGGETGDDRATQLGEGSATGTGIAESGGSGGSGSAAGAGIAESGAGGSGGSGNAAGTGIAESGAGGGSGAVAGTGSAESGAGGGSGAVAGSGVFVWTGYDVYPVEIDEAASGTPVPEGDPGNDYGRTVAGIACPDSGGYGTSGRCMDFMVCGHSCSSDEDCPQVDSGTTSPQCRDPWPVDCLDNTCFQADRCSLPCGGDLVCPNGMACVRFDSGFLCTWPTLMTGPVLEQDCPGYCQLQDGPCDSRTSGDCCRGYVCAPWGACEAGSCLLPSWPCSTDTAPCCEGTACVDGYCT